MKPPVHSGCTLSQGRPHLLPVVLFVLAVVTTSAPTTQAHRSSVSVHPSQTAPPSLCLEVDATLRHITSALRSCGGSEGSATTGASTSNNDNITTRRHGQEHERGSVDSVDLSPIHQLMGVLGCEGSGREYFPHSHIKAHKRRSARPTAAAAHTGEDHVDSSDEGGHPERLKAETLHDASRPVTNFATDPQQPQTHQPLNTTATGPELAPQKSSVKPVPFVGAHDRARRAHHVGTGECTFQDILNGTCAGADAGGRLNVIFDNQDDWFPEHAESWGLQELSARVGNLTINGVVHEKPLRWLLDNGNWSAVTDLELQGLQFRNVSFEMLNALSSLRDISINSNDHIDISPGGFTHAAHIHFLSITNSTLRHIPNDTFASFHALEILDLDRNLITAINSEVFAGLTSLTELRLSRNLISSVDNDTFRELHSLQNLTLWANNIESLPSGVFRSLTQLNWLDLRQNLLESLPEGLFSSLGALRHLYLRRARLTKLPGRLFEGPSKLEMLDLSLNQLTSLQEGVFHHLSSLAELRLNNNQISTLHPNAFGSLGSLYWLNLHYNSLSTLPSDLLSRCMELKLLVLSTNRLASLPNDIFTSTPKLQYLFVEQNRLTSLDGALAYVPDVRVLTATDNELTAVNVRLPSIERLVLGGNPMAKLPDVARMRNLTGFRAPGHHIQQIDLTPILGLKHLTEVDLSANASVTSTATVDAAALAAWTGNSLTTLHLSNVDISNLIAHEAGLPNQQFETLEIGWPGLNDQLLSLKALCSLLDANARELGIRNSSYEHIELCPDVQIDNVNLQDNAQLKTITASRNIVELHVSGSVRLETIDAPRVEVLDVSNTNLHWTSALCDTLGQRILLARGVPESAMDGPIIDRCLKKLDLLDLSDNPWLSSPAKINQAAGDVVAVSHRRFVTLGSAIIASRVKPPVLQLHRLPVECNAFFETRKLTLRSMNDTLGRTESQLVYFFHCECAQGHTLSNDNCVVQKPGIAATVAGSVFGGLIFGLLLVFLYRRYHFLTTRLGEHRQLLLESHDEVLALKKAWEISFEELRLIKRVAAGAFGVVYKAEWDTLMVAVKVLQQGAMALDENSVEEFEKEVEFLQRTRHPHVVRFFGAGTDPGGRPFLVLEFVALGSLKDFLQKGLEEQLHQAFEEEEVMHMGQEADDNVGMADVSGEDFTLVTTTTTINKRWSKSSETDAVITTAWDLKLRLLRDVASGMAFIHSLGQVHRDLKSGNVLVSANLRAKITDFGSIRQCFSRTPATRETAMPSTSHEPMYSQALGMATTADMTMTAGVGTPLYMAPESLSGGSYGAQADVFSFGVLMWEVALERVPDLIEQEKGAGFRGPLLSTLDNLLHQGKRLKFARAEAVDVPDWYVRIYRRCTLLDTKERPTFEQLNKSALRCE